MAYRRTRTSRSFYVYIMTNDFNTVLYTGITNDLERRVAEHKEGLTPGFTRRYVAHKLVYFEEFATAGEAIEREKQIKAGSRMKKVRLINSMNNEWKDLSANQ